MDNIAELPVSMAAHVADFATQLFGHLAPIDVQQQVKLMCCETVTCSCCLFLLPGLQYLTAHLCCVPVIYNLHLYLIPGLSIPDCSLTLCISHLLPVTYTLVPCQRLTAHLCCKPVLVTCYSYQVTSNKRLLACPCYNAVAVVMDAG